MIEMVLFTVRCLPHSVFSHRHICDMCKAVGSFEPVSTGDIKGCVVVTVDGMGSFT